MLSRSRANRFDGLDRQLSVGQGRIDEHEAFVRFGNVENAHRILLVDFAVLIRKLSLAGVCCEVETNEAKSPHSGISYAARFVFPTLGTPDLAQCPSAHKRVHLLSSACRIHQTSSQPSENTSGRSKPFHLRGWDAKRIWPGIPWLRGEAADKLDTGSGKISPTHRAKRKRPKAGQQTQDGPD